jgi:D-tyrosyl-tRNA(Tyr) deacylase
VKAVIQRVQHAKVEVDGQVVGQIGPGILTLLGVAQGDTPEQAEKLMTKILKLRIFEDDAGKMNRSVLELGLEHLIVSQFTLLADASSGNRPSFTGAARPEVAQPIYLHALKVSESLGVKTAGGRFQAEMKVSLSNDGPVTLVLEA